MKIKPYILSLLILIPCIASAQNIFTNLKSLEKRADILYKELAYTSAIDLYKQALTKTKNVSTIKIKIAKSYYALRINKEAESWYREAMIGKKSVTKSDSAIFYNVLMYNGKYEEAEKWAKSVSSKLKNSPIPSTSFTNAINALYRDSLCYSVEKSSFNSEFSDYSPVYFLGGILFISDKKIFSPIKQVNLQKDAGMSDVYYVAFKSINSKPIKITTGLKENMNIGPLTIYDNNRKIIFTSNNQEGNLNARRNLQLYSAEYNFSKKEWINIAPLNINNKNNSFGHPSIRKDGKLLYFVSDMPGGYGGTDIYVSSFQNNNWSKPQNLGGSVNTPGNEMFPYISNSGRLYFSSDNHKGLGGLDIFYIDSGAIARYPMNAGYPINSTHDDFGIITNDDDSSGYLSSNRNNDLGRDNIYKFKNKSVKIELNIFDDLTKKPLNDFKISLVDPEFNTGYEPGSNSVIQKGKYIYYLKPGHEYSLNVNKEDYQEYEEKISTQKESIIVRNIFLRRKYSYYANIRIRDSISENIVNNATVMFMNFTYEKIDSAKTDDKGIVNIKLDRDAEYFIFAKNKSTNGFIYIEKQPKRKASSVSYYSILTKNILEKEISLQVYDSTGKPAPETDIEVINLLTNENKKIKTGTDGRVDFTLINDRYYKIKCKGNIYQVEYDHCQKIISGSEIKLVIKRK